MDLLRRSNLASNFHRSLLEVRLGLLDESTAQSLIAWKAESEGIALSGPIQDYVVEVCGCHPKYIELAVEALAESKQAGDSEAKLSATVLEAITPLWQKAWQSLTSLQRAALASPITDDAPLVLARQHRSLEELALIQREGKGYRHFSKAFGAWVGQQGQGRSSTDPVQ
jgi:hypothetical protein